MEANSQHFESEEGRDCSDLCRAPHVGRLDSALRVRREMARIYRLARAGKLPWCDATKAAHVLSLILRAIEGHEIERRIAVLERQESPGCLS